MQKNVDMGIQNGRREKLEILGGGYTKKIKGGLEMKIRSCDMPTKDFSVANVISSLLNAIKAGKSGNYIDCRFESESEFQECIDSMIKSGKIALRVNPQFEGLNIGNFECSEDIEFRNRNQRLKYVIDLILKVAPVAIQIIAMVCSR